MPSSLMARPRRHVSACLILVALSAASHAFAADSPYFAIRVIDEATGGGVPLVELRTTNQVLYVTDSAGLVAFNEPGVMDGKHEVYFGVRSHGYEFPADGFGFRGARLKPVAGGEAVIKLKRLNIAERLYRVTGAGIYRDSVLLGRATPIKEPALNAQVSGQDSAHAALYGERVFWLWGDTNRPAYPLGNFSTTCATSLLPSAGGLDPARGVDLTYYMNSDGFTRPMVPRDQVDGPGPIWLSGLTTIHDDSGRQRLIAAYARVENLGKVLERGLVVFDDEKQVFQRLTRFDVSAPLHLDGHPMRVKQGGATWLYFAGSVPYNGRVRADWRAVQDLTQYEGYTCLTPGGRFAGRDTKIDRDANGRIVWAWKKDTPAPSYDEQQSLIRAGLLNDDEAQLGLRGIETGQAVRPHAASICWNAHRKRWVALFSQIGGTSFLGETWFAEADTPVGPWGYARKIVTHERYSFYNPVQHPYFAEDGGRRVYFEGTYTGEFSGARDGERTPRYDYNQIMYRLDMNDERLTLPIPVYQVNRDGKRGYTTRDGIAAGDATWESVERVAFYALPPTGNIGKAIAVYAVDRERLPALSTQRPPGGKSAPLFFAAAEGGAPGVVGIHESRDEGGYRYLPQPDDDKAGKPAFYAWPSASAAPMVNGEATAAE